MIDRPLPVPSVLAPTVLLSLSLTTGCQTMSENPDLQDPLDTLSGGRPAGTTLLLDREFQQGWRASPEENFVPARVRLYRGSDAFYIYAVLADRVMGNTATGFNERTWQTGDVFEIFIQTEADTYYEFHVTPENQNLFLAWRTESFAAVRAKTATVEDSMIGNPDFLETTTEIFPDDQLWTVRARIPYESLNFDSEGRHPDLKMAFARYDTTPGEEEPVLSATPKFPAKSYHNREVWQPVEWEWGNE